MTRSDRTGALQAKDISHGNTDLPADLEGGGKGAALEQAADGGLADGEAFSGLLDADRRRRKGRLHVPLFPSIHVQSFNNVAASNASPVSIRINVAWPMPI